MGGATAGGGPGRRRAAVLAIALALGCGASLPAMDWPLAPPRLAATFGTFARDRVVTGVALAADDGLVRAADGGEISFVYEEGARAASLPSALGSYAIVEHGKGMAGIYSHFQAGTISSYLRNPKAGDILGKPGASGWIEGPGIVFQVYDRLAGSWVNPLLVLGALADDKPPLVRSLALSRDGKTTPIGEAARLTQGTYAISVDVVDPADAPWTAGPLAPYRILVSVDGVEIAKEAFDVAQAKGGKLLLFASSPVPAGELRTAEGRYSIAERLFARGRATIEVRVEDAAGNKRSASWTIEVE